jgi:hypothetical protein
VSTDTVGGTGRTDVEKKIASGRLLGYSENGIDAFLGIPYPAGVRRGLWSGIR